MPAPSKKPRRTAERILEAALRLFNRFGEPNVATTLVATELGISPGNLHYHFPTKEALLSQLADAHEAALAPLLDAASEVRHVEDAWLLFHMLFELIWQYRFLYRDINNLISKSRKLEAHVQRTLERKSRAVQSVLAALTAAGEAPGLGDATPETTTLARSMVVVLTYWLSYEDARDPRRALQPEFASAALARGAFHVLGLLMPYLAPPSRAHLLALAAPYVSETG